MLELLYSTIIVLGIGIIPYFIFVSFQNFRIFLFLFQFIICLILICFHPYKHHSLWHETEYKYEHLQKTPYLPIVDLYLDLNNELKYNVTKDNIFSINKTDIYSKECIENYFIRNNETCPITDIIVEYNINNTNALVEYENIKINNYYIFYRRDFMFGKLYQSIGYSYYSSNKIYYESTFDYRNVQKIKKKEACKLINPFLAFKNFIGYSDFISLELFIFSFIYYLLESRKDMNWNYFRIIDYIMQLFISVLNIIRYNLFIKIKKFLKNNKEFYKSNQENYFPRSINADSFPIAIAIAMIVYFLLFVLIKKKPSCQSKPYGDEKYNCFSNESKKRIRIYWLLLPFIPMYFFIFIKDIISDYHINQIYKSIIYNWELKPITSIEINSKQDYELGHVYLKKKYNDNTNYYFYNWRNKYLAVKNLDNYNYINLYSNNNGKICGIDSFGNKLFFPENIECPINDIYIDNQSSNNNSLNYTHIYLGNNIFLHFTNQNTNGHILIDIKASNQSNQLNYEKTNDICELLNGQFNIVEQRGCKKYFHFNATQFYKKIDSWSLYYFIKESFYIENDIYLKEDLGNIDLNSFTYLGLNSTKNKNKQKIKNYINKMDIFIPLSILKDVFSGINIIFFIFFSVILIKKSSSKCLFHISVFFILLILFYLIITIICLNINLNYIQNFMSKISDDLEYYKYYYIWTLILVVYAIFFIFCYIGVVLYLFFFKENSIFKINCDLLKCSCACNCACNCCKKVGKKKEKINPPIPHDISNISITNIDTKENKNLDTTDNKTESSSKNECIICYINPKQITFAPCGHKCICKECYQKL